MAEIVTVFRSRLRPGVEAEYVPLAGEMMASARAMPGFVDARSFTAPDGERVTIVQFSDRPSHDAWRDHPGHRRAQERGRADFYSEYTIQVCELVSERSFTAHQQTGSAS